MQELMHRNYSRLNNEQNGLMYYTHGGALRLFTCRVYKYEVIWLGFLRFRY